MKNRKKVINSLSRLASIFELLHLNSINDPYFPDQLDFDSIAASKIELSKVELLLLNKPTVAITEAAHAANTALSEVPTSESDTHIGVVGADSSETEIVKQNEQTKKQCHIGKYGHEVQHCFMLPCATCPHYK